MYQVACHYADGSWFRDQIKKMIRIVNSFFLIEFLNNIVNKILIFLRISLSKRRLPRLLRPHVTGLESSGMKIIYNIQDILLVTVSRNPSTW